MPVIDRTEPLIQTTVGFADQVLGLKPYDWQARALYPIEEWQRDGQPRQIAVKAPNGSGKDGIIIPCAVYYFLVMNPQGRVIITTKSGQQLETQTLVNLDKHYRKLGWEEPVRSPRYMLKTTSGGSLLAFVTNDALRVEGHHSRPGEPLMLIVNEAKGFDMWEGIDRCTPDIMLMVSSPGLREGRFFDAFTKLRSRYFCVSAGLIDCPHIPKNKIDDVNIKYGPDDPVTRSTLHGEFMAQRDGEQFICLQEWIESNLAFPPKWKPGIQYGFFDFADGRAENVFVRRSGNKIWIEDSWRSQNEDAVVGRAIYLCARSGLKQNQIAGDAAAKGILDKMGSSGWAIHRQNFGQRMKKSPYTSWSSMAWIEGAAKIRNRDFIIPDDDVFIAQACSRKKIFRPDGLMMAEDKTVMRKERNIESPDRADCIFGIMSVVDTYYQYEASPPSWDDLKEDVEEQDRELAKMAGY